MPPSFSVRLPSDSGMNRISKTPPGPSGREHPLLLLSALLVVGGLMIFVHLSYRNFGFRESAVPEITAPWTTASAREAQRRHTRDEVIGANLGLPPASGDNARWQSFLSAVKWNGDHRPEVLAALRHRLEIPGADSVKSDGFTEVQRLAMETAFGLFPTELEPEMRQIFLTDTDPKRLAMAGAWLARMDSGAANRKSLEDSLRARKPDWAMQPQLLALVTGLRAPRTEIMRQRPPLNDLLRAPFGGRPVIFSLQRIDRRFAGRAVVRSADGSFLVEPDGTPFSALQFALSVSGLPGTLTNGNTPCGIFGIEEFGHTGNTAIGPSETIVLGLPLEYDKTWTEARYEDLLPESWKSWWPIREAWWAGQAGRFEILAHGTAIDPEPWTGTVFAGLTPSHGCLTCDESWDPSTGRRLASEQARLTTALRRAGGPPAWLVVVEIDAAARPVTREDVGKLLK